MHSGIKSMAGVQRQNNGKVFVYDAMCKVLSGKANEVNWPAFSTHEWQLLETMADSDAEGVAALLYWQLRSASWPREMPVSLRTHLTRSYYNTLAHNMLLYQELAAIIREFTDHDIPVLVLKGAALAATAYDDVGLRPMGDIDLLVRPQDLSLSWKLLSGLGFDVHAANTEIALRKAAVVEVSVDLHWCIVSGYESRSTEMKWFELSRDRFTVPNSNQTAEVLSNHFHLAYIASHAYPHAPLRAYYDIFTLLKSLNAQKKEVTDFAEKLGWLGQLENMTKQTDERFAMGPQWDFGTETTRPNKISRSRVVFKAWQLLDLKTRLYLVYKILFPTQRYLEIVYGKHSIFKVPYLIVFRWLDLCMDILKTVFETWRKKETI